MSVYNTQEIMEILPHRHPFLLIDTIEELEPGVRAVGRKNVTFNEPYFAGHFPGNPVMPGVLIMEALAQTGAVAILSLPEHRGKTAYFAGIDKAKFKQMVRPGDTLELETTIIRSKGPPGDQLELLCALTAQHGSVGFGSAEALVDGEVACKAELTFALK